jgi:hypothetical protein
MATLSKFGCDGCNRKFAWKPELAGKMMRCKCGAVLAVPRGETAAAAVSPMPAAVAMATPARPAAPVMPRVARSTAVKAPVESDPEDGPSLDDLYAFADEAEKARQAAADDLSGGIRCPGCTAEAAPGAMLCTACGMNFQTGQRLVTAVVAEPAAGAKRSIAVPGRAAVAAPGRGGPKVLGYAGRNPRADAAVASDSREAMKMLIGPAVLFGLGLVLTFVDYMFHWKMSVGSASIAVAVNLLVSMVLIFVGCLIAIRLLNFSLGSPQEAALKVAAVALLPAAVSGMIAWQFGVAGGMAGWGVSLILYFSLLKVFFDLDLMEINILTTIIWLVQTWVGYALIAIILAALTGGNSMLSGGAMGFIGGAMGGGSPGVRDSSPTGQINKRAERYKMAANAFEAKEWLAGGAERTIMGFDREKSLAAIKFDTKEIADKVVADMPDDQATRDKIVAVHKPLFENREVGPVDHSNKQEFIILDFDGNDE